MKRITSNLQVEVHLKFKMVPETLYLTVDLIDRFLEKKQVRRSKLQLVGVAALLVILHNVLVHSFPETYHDYQLTFSPPPLPP